VEDIFWQQHRDMALLEMARKQCKAHEETEKVGENDPLVMDVGNKPADARSGLEPRECDFVNGDRGQTTQRDRKRVAMKNRNSQQSHSEQNEIDRNIWHPGL
jgi:hypothetical protein